MFGKKDWIALFLVFSIVFAMGCYAEQIVFQNGLNGYNGVSDTYLNGYHETRKTHNFGASEILKVLGVPWGGLKQPALIRFDNIVGSEPHQIPQDAVITSARLELYKTRVEGIPANYKIHVNEMLTDWKAGSSNGRAEEGSSCYAYRYYQKKAPEKWGAEEGDDQDGSPVRAKDYINHPSVAELPIGEEANVWMSFDVTGIVNDWVNGKKENYGFLIRAGGYWVGAEFYSSDYKNVEYRPKLVIDYVMKEDIKYRASDNWKVSVVPASLNEDQTIKLVPGYTQPLNVMFQAKKQVINSATAHSVELEIDLPKTMEVVEVRGNIEVIDSHKLEFEDRYKAIYNCSVKNSNILSEPGTRLNSEWNGMFLAVSVPEAIPAEESYLNITIRHNDTFATNNWEIQLTELPQKGTQLKKTRIALWDYGMNFLDKTTTKTGKFLADMGVNHVQRGNQGYLGYRANGISTGGYIHHSVFYNGSYPDVNVQGKVVTSSFSDPQAVIDTKGDILDKTIVNIISASKSEDRMATFDFEPTGFNGGFSEQSIAQFKKQYNVSDSDFVKLHELMKKDGMQSYKAVGEEKELYEKWVEFRSWQVSNYVKTITESVKKHDPQTVLQMTTGVSCGPKDPLTIATGVDCAAMGNQIDAIMPQIYRGYGNSETKNAIITVKRWRENVDSQLYPILLVRYAGASAVKNTPSRVRQQIIGSIAEGADGIYLYYPQLMDATYWGELAQATRELQFVEDFYREGIRCDDLFEFKGMPLGQSQIIVWPNVVLDVENPDWHYTAHKHGEMYCVTLWNLKEANEMVFTFATEKKLEIVEMIGADLTKDEDMEKAFLISQQDVAYIILKEDK